MEKNIRDILLDINSHLEVNGYVNRFEIVEIYDNLMLIDYYGEIATVKSWREMYPIVFGIRTGIRGKF